MTEYVVVNSTWPEEKLQAILDEKDKKGLAVGIMSNTGLNPPLVRLGFIPKTAFKKGSPNNP